MDVAAVTGLSLVVGSPPLLRDQRQPPHSALLCMPGPGSSGKVSRRTKTNFTKSLALSAPGKSSPSPPLQHRCLSPRRQHLCPGLRPRPPAGSPAPSTPSKSDALFKYKPNTCDFQTKPCLRHLLELTLPQILNF